MISVTFAGVAIQAWQEAEINYLISTRETQLLSGDRHVSLSLNTSGFPVSFDCYTESSTEITDLVGMIGTVDTLVINSTSYSNCYILSLREIHIYNKIRTG